MIQVISPVQGETMIQKKYLFFILLALGAPINAPAEHEDDENEFSSFLDSLFSSEESDENPFLSMFKEKPSEKKPTTAKDAAIDKKTLLSPEQVTAFQQKLSNLLTPLSQLITQMHVLHPVWGATLYPKVIAHKALFSKTESTLLHLEALFKKLPPTELATFNKILDAQEKTIATMLQSLISLIKKTEKPSMNVADENKFILGRLGAAAEIAIALTPAEQKKILSSLEAIKPKLEIFEKEIQKIMVSPEIKKLFPEIPAAPIKLGSAPRNHSSSYQPTSSSRQTQGKNGSYAGRNSRYSSSHPYNDYGYDYDDYGYGKNPNQTPEHKKSELNPNDKKPNEPENADKRLEDEKAAKRETEKLDEFVSHINNFVESQLVSQLQKTLQDGSMLKNPGYFSDLATTFEFIFGQNSDGGFTALSNTVKHLEGSYAHAKTALDEYTKKNAEKQIKKLSDPLQNPNAPKDLKAESMATLKEAISDYEETKQALATASIRLLNLPTERRIDETITDDDEDQPSKTVWMLPAREQKQLTKSAETQKVFSEHVLMQQDALCRRGRETLKNFVTMLETKANLASYITLQKDELEREIETLENARSKNIATAINEILETEIEKAATLTILNKRLRSLTRLADEIRTKSPTTKTVKTHFGQPAREITRSVEVNEQELTSQEKVVRALRQLEQKLEATQTKEKSPELTTAIEKVRKTILKTTSAWTNDLAMQQEERAERINKPQIKIPAPETANKEIPAIIQKPIITQPKPAPTEPEESGFLSTITNFLKQSKK